MRTLVVNLTRFGDLVQSQPALAGLSARGDRLALACLENFAPAARLLTGVEHVAPLPGAKLLGAGSNWRPRLAALWEWAEGLKRGFGPERVVNITPSVSGRLLARLFPEAEQVGLSLDEFGFSLDQSPWAAFLQTSATHRGASPFNVSDLFRRVAGLDASEVGSTRLRQPDSGDRARVAEMLASGPANRSGWLAVQLGASEERRRWPVASFARLAEAMWTERGLAPLVLGGPGEEGLAERFQAECGAPGLSLAGRTSLPQLAAALGESDLLATNDTGTMHLAAAVGTPLAAIFLCTAQPWDTGPFLEGSLCLEPDMDCHPCAFGRACQRGEACRRAVRPETVTRLCLGLLDGDPSGSAADGTRVWRTMRDQTGYLGLERLGGAPPDDRHAWVLIQRAVYGRFLDGLDPLPLPNLPRLSPEAEAETAKVLREAGDVCLLLTRQGQVLLRDPVPALKTKFLAYWQRLVGLLREDRRLSPLGRLLTARGEECGGDLASFLEVVVHHQRAVEAFSRAVGLAPAEA